MYKSINSKETLCGIEATIYENVKKNYERFYYGLNEGNERCTENSDNCDMDYAGYGYCNDNNRKKCKNDGECGDSNCEDKPKIIEKSDEYQTALNNYITEYNNKLSPTPTETGYLEDIIAIFENMKMYDNYVEEDGMLNGYSAHCV